MTLDDIQMLQDLPSMSECLKWALHATSFAQTQSDDCFDKIDELQQAYIILHKVYLEAKDQEKTFT